MDIKKKILTSMIIGLTIIILLILTINKQKTDDADSNFQFNDSNFQFNIHQEINNDNEYKLFIINTTFNNGSLIKAKKYSYTKKQFVDECEEEYDTLSKSWKNTLWKSKTPIASHCFNHIKVPLTTEEVKIMIKNNSYKKASECKKENICYELIKQ